MNRPEDKQYAKWCEELEADKKALRGGAQEPLPKSQAQSGSLCSGRFVSWLDAKVDRAVELGVDDFEKKCDAAARTFSTIAFTFCAVVVIVAVALKWFLAS